MTPNELIEINPYDVKVLVHREREQEGFKNLKWAIAAIGVRQPVQVRDISSWPAKDRMRPEGGLYKWEAHFGEGRTTALKELYEETGEARFLKLPAIVREMDETDMAGAFLSENLLRRDHTWLDQAKLIRADANRGLSVKEIAARFFIDERHAKKLIHILDGASHRLKKQLPEMTLKEATVITVLPAKAQEIVLDAMTEEAVPKANLEHVVAKAKALEDRGELSKSALKASLKRVGEDLARMRERLKLYRLHASLGPENLKLLLSDKRFCAELDRCGIKYQTFMERAS